MEMFLGKCGVTIITVNQVTFSCIVKMFTRWKSNTLLC